jgi:hypothetical protein
LTAATSFQVSGLLGVVKVDDEVINIKNISHGRRETFVDGKRKSERERDKEQIYI